MNKAEKTCLICIMCFLALSVFVSRSSALMEKNLKKGKILMEDGQYPQAIEFLEKAVLENLTHAEVHFLLGTAYINNDNFRGADEVFESAFQLDADYGYRIGREYKKIANWSFNAGDYSAACDFFEKAVQYDPMIGQNEGYNFFASLGDKTGNAEYYAKSIIYAQGDKQKYQRIAFKLLKQDSQRCLGQQCQDLKEEINSDVRQELSGNVFRAPSTKVVLEKTFTYNDAFEKEFGQIKAIKFARDDIRIDDEIEVTAQLKDGSKFSGKEIGVWMGNDYDQGWVKTENGRYTEKIKKIPGGSLIISLAKRKDIKVAVKVKRKIIPEKKLSENS